MCPYSAWWCLLMQVLTVTGGYWRMISVCRRRKRCELWCLLSNAVRITACCLRNRDSRWASLTLQDFDREDIGTRVTKTFFFFFSFFRFRPNFRAVKKPKTHTTTRICLLHRLRFCFLERQTNNNNEKNKNKARRDWLPLPTSHAFRFQYVGFPPSYSVGAWDRPGSSGAGVCYLASKQAHSFVTVLYSFVCLCQLFCTSITSAVYDCCVQFIQSFQRERKSLRQMRELLCFRLFLHLYITLTIIQSSSLLCFVRMLAMERSLCSPVKMTTMIQKAKILMMR